MSERYKYKEYRIIVDMNEDYEINIIDNDDGTEMYFSFDDFDTIVDLIRGGNK